MRLTTISTLALAAVGLMFSASAFADSDSWSVSVNQEAASLVPDNIREQGVIQVGSGTAYPPFEYFAKDNETMIGYDIDVSDAIGATLGLEVEHVPAPFSSIIPGLAALKYDMAMSAFGITAERKKVIDFVGPYVLGGTGLAVQKGNPLGLKMSQESLCGQTIGGLRGTYQASQYLPDMSDACVEQGKEPITIKVYRTQSEANLALVSGRVAGVLADSAPLAYQAKLAGDRFELAPGPNYKPVPFGIALPEESELKPAVKAALQSLKDSGVLAKILKKWGMNTTWLNNSGN